MELKNLILISSAMVLIIFTAASCYPSPNESNSLRVKPIDRGGAQRSPSDGGVHRTVRNIHQEHDEGSSRKVRSASGRTDVKLDRHDFSARGLVQISGGGKGKAEARSKSAHLEEVEDLEAIKSAQEEADRDLLDGLNMILNRNETLEDVFNSEKFSGFPTDFPTVKN